MPWCVVWNEIDEQIVKETRRDFARVFKCDGIGEWRKALVLEPDSKVRFDALIEDILADSDAFPLNQLLPFLREIH